MNAHWHLVFAPFIAIHWLEAFAFLAALLIGYALLQHAKGASLRAALFALFLLALANPSLIADERIPLKDTALIVIDDSASMQLEDRAQQAAKAAEEIGKKLAAFPDLNVETLHVKGTTETDLFAGLAQELSEIPKDRLAGALLITDGEVHDQPETPLAAPVHVLIAGHHDEVDRRLMIEAAPAYGLVGKRVTLSLRIDDAPKAQSGQAAVTFRRDDGETETMMMPIGKDVKFDVPIGHPGQNLFVFSTPSLPHELTALNNTASITINGIRDRLRVLLISGAPHIGERTWRNFLKSDPAVDLIHFTILRSPAKFDAVPESELSLIAFPVHELFATKLSGFDLIIFDRFRQQSLIDDEYLDNIAHYVEQGGALLISNATDDAGSPFNNSPLARILPAQPTGHLLTGRFVPNVTEIGARHPVTGALTKNIPQNTWGPWFRQIEAHTTKGEILMSGLNKQPLLVLDHVGKGRVAQFLSDQFWLWSKGYEGGGPQAELLRRVAHWLVGEPELDESALRAQAQAAGGSLQLVITKQSLHGTSATVAVTGPDNQTSQVTLNASKEPGVLSATIPVSSTGLYHIKDNAKETLVLVGPGDVPEFGDMIATEDKLAPLVKPSGGGIFWLADYPYGPAIHRTSAGGAQNGWNWLGLRQNGQYRVTGSRAWPLWPVWVALLALLGAALLAWQREGKS